MTTTTTPPTAAELKAIMTLRSEMADLLNGASYGDFGLRSTHQGTAILEGVEILYASVCTKAARMHSEYMVNLIAGYKAENEAAKGSGTLGPSMSAYTSRGLHPRDFA